MVAQGDTDGDGALSKKELLDLLALWFTRMDVEKTGKLTREQFIAALIADVPPGLKPDAWAEAVPRVVSVYEKAMAEREGGFPLPADRCALHADVRDLLAGRGSTLGVALPWQRHYDAAVWELRPHGCSGGDEPCEPTAGPYAPHQPRQCVRCGRALPMTIAEQADHDALWGITPLPKRGHPLGATTQLAADAWRWAVCMAAKLPQTLADLDAAGWRRLAVALVEESEIAAKEGTVWWADWAVTAGPLIADSIRRRDPETQNLYAIPRPIETPWQGVGDPEVGP